jgi:hypothetical protein
VQLGKFKRKTTIGKGVCEADEKGERIIIRPFYKGTSFYLRMGKK